ncbi:hypothetical protein ACP4OV_024551 [Aristida adscensionis]
MDTVVSAVLGDLVSRTVSFVVDRYYRQPKGAAENQQRLRHVLLRIKATVEEAERRHITNQAMLQQLQKLREAMYKGCYLLDTVSYRMLQQERASDQVGTHSFALTKFSPGKRLCFSTRNMNIACQDDEVKEVQKMLGTLHSIIDDMAEFIVFLKFYPPISREPYNKYLFVENCMFGRQEEMEKIINFLLQPEPPEAQGFQVLPIIGPRRVGKSTLVEHVCYDERVHNHFSSIILCRGEGGSVVKKQTRGSHERSLVIMDQTDDLVDLVQYERQCNKLYYTGTQLPPGSKVIITSISENILRLGTTRAIRLNFLPWEAYWYFFKVMAFGSTNPEEHPELASIAMDIAADLHGSFMGANIIGGYMRANMQNWFWRKILELQINHIERNNLLFGEHPHSLLQKNQTAYLWSMSNMDLKACYREKYHHQNEIPKIMLHEIQIGSAEPHGKFEVVIWKSHIPPYHSYVMSCEMEAPQHMIAKKKRPYSMA